MQGASASLRSCPWIWIAGLTIASLPGIARDGAPAERDLSKPILIGAVANTFPYSFLDTDNQLKGFAVDLSDAVTAVMDFRTKRVILPTTGLENALRAGRIDFIQFWGETPARRLAFDFTVPILRFETVVVVRKDEQRILSLADLKGRRVAVGQRGTVGDRYLLEQQPEAIPVYTETTEKYLRMLAAGECDAAALSRLTAVSMIDRLGLKNLKVLGDKVQDYDVRYCFVMQKGDALLLARLNEGLAILHRTGEFDDIYYKWFGRYEKRTFTPVQVVSYVAVALALACAAATWGFLRQRTLSRRIARQAAELAEQRSLLAALYDKHPLATVVLEIPAEGSPRLISVNSEAARLFGLNPAAVANRLLDDCPLPPDLRSYWNEVITRWRTAQTDRWETRLAATQLLLETAFVPLGSSDSGWPRLCVLTADVTKRRLMDHEVAQSRRLRALGELVGGIAHEFNNLLTPIIATTNLLQLERKADPTLQADLAMIEQAGTRAAELTRRLLTFGRKTGERIQSVAIADAVANCFALLQPTADRRIEWASSVPSALPPILLNPIDLNQIVFNLVINARDTLSEKLAQSRAMAWTPRLRVSAEELPPTARPVRLGRPSRTLVAWQQLTVEDNGLGIRPEIIDRIFEPFFTTKEVGKGTGLGLATIWHLVTDAGGEVTVESKAGEGSKFHVTFPRWQPEPAQPGGDAKPLAAPDASAGRRILLVEDEPLVARTCVAMLKRFGHTVNHVADGADAWSHLAGGQQPYDLLLLDLNMPRMNGIDLVRRVRETRYAGRIVIMSGRVTEEDRRALEGLRVDFILGKPFTPEEFTEALGGDGPRRA
jgi:signal transduction histidine kinase/ABC-type amino acid transport substrate-binding protein/CheY-like chemotaxis protein